MKTAEIIQMKRLLLCLNLFNIWMADRAWMLKSLPFQGRVGDKEHGIGTQCRIFGFSPVLAFLFKKKKKSQLHLLILQEGCCLEINYYGM